MIKCTKAKTSLKGSPAQITEDYINISISIRRMFEECMSATMARQCMVSCLKIAFTDEDDEETKDQYSEELASRVIDGIAEKLNVEKGAE